MNEINLVYDKDAKKATLTFPNGRQMRLANVTEEQAREFVAKNGAEFQRRDCILHTSGDIEVRTNA